MPARNLGAIIIQPTDSRSLWQLQCRLHNGVYKLSLLDDGCALEKDRTVGGERVNIKYAAWNDETFMTRKVLSYKHIR